MGRQLMTAKTGKKRSSSPRTAAHERIMLEYARFSIARELLDNEYLNGLGFFAAPQHSEQAKTFIAKGLMSATANSFSKKYKVSKNTITAWEQPGSKYWEMFCKEDGIRWRRKRPVAMHQLLRGDPAMFLRVTWPEEMRSKMATRSEIEQLPSGTAPEEMTDEQIAAAMADLDAEIQSLKERKK